MGLQVVFELQSQLGLEFWSLSNVVIKRVIMGLDPILPPFLSRPLSKSLQLLSRSCSQ